MMTSADRAMLDNCMAKLAEVRTLIEGWTAVAIDMRDLNAANAADLDAAVDKTNSMGRELEQYNDFVMALSADLDAHLGLHGPVH